MATYLCVKANNQNKSFTAKESKEAGKPYLCVKASNSVGYFPLTTETSTGTKIKVKANNGNTYRIVETYTTTQQITVTTGTSYETRSSTSATTYYTRSSTSATNYKTRASTSATNYLTRASTYHTEYGITLTRGKSINFGHILNVGMLYTCYTSNNGAYSVTNVKVNLSFGAQLQTNILGSCTKNSITKSSNGQSTIATASQTISLFPIFNLIQSSKMNIYSTTVLSSSVAHIWQYNASSNRIEIPVDFYTNTSILQTTVQDVKNRSITYFLTKSISDTKSSTNKSRYTYSSYTLTKISLFRADIVTTGTTYLTRSSTSATQYATRSSTSATEYATRSSTSVTSYLTRSSTSNTVYLTTTSSEQITTQ